MKRALVIVGSIFLITAMAYPVFAWGPGWGRGHHRAGPYGGPGYCWDEGPGYGAAIAPEERTQLEELNRKFYDETADLRGKIWSKRGEFHALMNSTDPDVEKANGLQRELNELRNQMAEKRLAHELEVRKVAPEAGTTRGYGRGYGPGKKGYGHGPGYGWSRKGHGRGGCWY